MPSQTLTKTSPSSLGSLAGPFAVLAAAMIWGTNGVAQVLAPADASPFALGFVRISITGLSLAMTCIGERPFPGIGNLFSPAVFAGAIGVGLFNLCYFAAVLRIGVALGTVIIVGTAPFCTGLLARTILKEKLSKTWLQAAFIGLVGLSLICGASGMGTLDPAGILLALITSLSYGIFCVASKMARKDLSLRMTPAVMVCLASLIIAPKTLTLDFSWIMSSRGICVAAYLGLISGALGFLLFSIGLSRTPTSQVPVLGLAEPLTASALGCLLLGEQLTLTETAGALLILVGLIRLVMPAHES